MGMGDLLPLSPKRIAFYLQQLVEALREGDTEASAPSKWLFAKLCVTQAQTGRAEVMLEMPVGFWNNLKYGIEYVIDTCRHANAYSAENDALLERAMREYEVFLDWMNFILGVPSEPNLIADE